MTIRNCILMLILASSLLIPTRVLACACCADPGEYRISFSTPRADQLDLMRRLRFGPTAGLFSTAAGPEENARGLNRAADSYAINGSPFGRLWKLMFRDGSESGALSLPLPAKLLSYRADIHDGQLGGGGGPLLYKEWRFEGPASGTGFFRSGLVAPAKYFLVLQGRGNNCDNAEDFTHWRLEIRGRKAAYAFHGELAKPIAGSTE